MTFEDAVRPFQTGGSTQEQVYLSQYGLASNIPIIVTPGFGGNGGSLPPLNTGSGHLNETIQYYSDQAAVEVTG
jgi:hypothetical protein